MDGRTGKCMDGQTDRWVMEGFLLSQSPTVRCLNLTVFLMETHLFPVLFFKQ